MSDNPPANLVTILWQQFSGERATGWYRREGDGSQPWTGPFATRAEAEQHAKESGK